MRKLFFSFLLALLVPMVAGAQEPYAALSNNNTVLTFYYDNQKANRNGMDVGPFRSYSGWYEQRENVTSVVFDESFADCTTLTSTAYWFQGFKNLSSISGISNLKTDNVTTIYAGDGWSTANVLYGEKMFNGCTNLVGGAGTPFDANHIDYTYARIDGGIDNPGYFTAKAEGATQTWAEGDLNHDGKVDAADVVWLTNLIMNQKKECHARPKGSLATRGTQE